MLLIAGALIELGDGRFHFLYGDIGVVRAANRDLSSPTCRAMRSMYCSFFIAPHPWYRLRQWERGRQPHGEGFGEILVRMLLRIPAFDVPHILPRKRNRACSHPDMGGGMVRTTRATRES